MSNYLRIALMSLPMLVVTNASTSATEHEVKSTTKSFVESDKVAAFVHVKLAKLASLEQMKLPKQLIKNVQRELDELFDFHVAFKASAVQSFTFVQPQRASLSPSNEKSIGLFLVEFSDSFDLKKLQDKSWKVSVFQGRELFENGTGICITTTDRSRIVIGSAEDVQWFVKHADRSVLESSGFASSVGQVIAGVNLTSSDSMVFEIIPQEVFAWFPAKKVYLAFDLSSGFAVSGDFDFESERDAQNASVFLKSTISRGKKYLEQQSKDALGSFRAEVAEMESAINHLGMISVMRQGMRMLDKVKMTKNGTNLKVGLAVDEMDSSLVILSSLTAIQMIGASAEEARFQDIADELDSAQE